MLAHRARRARLVLAHEARVADDVGGEDRGEAAGGAGGLVAHLRAIRAPDCLVQMNLGDQRAGHQRRSRWFRQPVETIALAGHRDNETRLFGIGLDLAPQSADQRIDASVEWLELPVERCVQQCVPAQHATRPGDEHPEQRELAAGQRDGVARLTSQRAGVEIEDEAGKPHRRLRFARRLYAFSIARFRDVPHGRSSDMQACNCYTQNSENYKAVTAATSATYSPRPTSSCRRDPNEKRTVPTKEA